MAKIKPIPQEKRKKEKDQTMPYDVLLEAEWWVKEAWSQGTYFRAEDLSEDPAFASIDRIVGGNEKIEIHAVCTVGATAVARLLIDGDLKKGRARQILIDDPAYAGAIQYLDWAISGDWDEYPWVAESNVDAWNEMTGRTREQVLEVFAKAKRAALVDERNPTTAKRRRAQKEVSGEDYARGGEGGGSWEDAWDTV